MCWLFLLETRVVPLLEDLPLLLPSPFWVSPNSTGLRNGGFCRKSRRFVCPVKSGPGKFSSRDPLRVSQSPETHRLGCPSFCALSARGGWLVEAGARRGLDRLEVGRLCRPTRVSRLARLGSTKPNGEKAGTGMQKPTVPRAPGLPPEKVVGVGARGV